MIYLIIQQNSSKYSYKVGSARKTEYFIQKLFKKSNYVREHSSLLSNQLIGNKAPLTWISSFPMLSTYERADCETVKWLTENHFQQTTDLPSHRRSLGPHSYPANSHKKLILRAKRAEKAKLLKQIKRSENSAKEKAEKTYKTQT